ncbi:hypothetical protein GWI33_002571 [Rhynchophorus ferrugineus]|uniref:Mos1 transposase HTH domain-containing protein n=1 Tax=Rhynchophorus ferrugineus TaxID=354439 RepID=A0A834IYI7_RHYFE|nr:hypothetical protein GWI33_002571 [Rhynchophorus ferrugineus]
MDKKEFSVLIKYCFLKGKNTVEAKTWLDAMFPDTAPGKSTIKDWYAKFRRGEMNIEEGECSGHPKEGKNDAKILKKRPILKNEENIFHQNNAPVHKGALIMEKLKFDIRLEHRCILQSSPNSQASIKLRRP